MDLTTGLTQVLDGGANTYLYGRGSIGEEQPGGLCCTWKMRWDLRGRWWIPQIYNPHAHSDCQPSEVR